MRLAADFSFHLRDYEGAIGYYKSLISDFKQDRNWKHVGGCYEFQALCTFLNLLSTVPPPTLMSSNSNSALNGTSGANSGVVATNETPGATSTATASVVPGVALVATSVDAAGLGQQPWEKLFHNAFEFYTKANKSNLAVRILLFLLKICDGIGTVGSNNSYGTSAAAAPGASDLPFDTGRFLKDTARLVYKCSNESLSQQSTLVSGANAADNHNQKTGLLLEQAAELFGKARLFRKHAFHLVLAGHTYQKSGLKRLALRCYSVVIRYCYMSNWTHTTDHTVFTMARHCYGLGLFPEAIFHFHTLASKPVLLAPTLRGSPNASSATAFLGTGARPTREQTYLKEFLSTLRVQAANLSDVGGTTATDSLAAAYRQGKRNCNVMVEDGRTTPLPAGAAAEQRNESLSLKLPWIEAPVCENVFLYVDGDIPLLWQRYLERHAHAVKMGVVATAAGVGEGEAAAEAGADGTEAEDLADDDVDRDGDHAGTTTAEAQNQFSVELSLFNHLHCVFTLYDVRLEVKLKPAGGAAPSRPCSVVANPVPMKQVSFSSRESKRLKLVCGVELCGDFSGTDAAGTKGKTALQVTGVSWRLNDCSERVVNCFDLRGRLVPDFRLSASAKRNFSRLRAGPGAGAPAPKSTAGGSPVATSAVALAAPRPTPTGTGSPQHHPLADRRLSLLLDPTQPYLSTEILDLPSEVIAGETRTFALKLTAGANVARLFLVAVLENDPTSVVWFSETETNVCEKEQEALFSTSSSELLLPMVLHQGAGPIHGSSSAGRRGAISTSELKICGLAVSQEGKRAWVTIRRRLELVHRWRVAASIHPTFEMHELQLVLRVAADEAGSSTTKRSTSSQSTAAAVASQGGAAASAVCFRQSRIFLALNVAAEGPDVGVAPAFSSLVVELPLLKTGAAPTAQDPVSSQSQYVYRVNTKTLLAATSTEGEGSSVLADKPFWRLCPTSDLEQLSVCGEWEVQAPGTERVDKERDLLQQDHAKLPGVSSVRSGDFYVHNLKSFHSKLLPLRITMESATTVTMEAGNEATLLSDIFLHVQNVGLRTKAAFKIQLIPPGGGASGGNTSFPTPQIDMGFQYVGFPPAPSEIVGAGKKTPPGADVEEGDKEKAATTSEDNEYLLKPGEVMSLPLAALFHRPGRFNLNWFVFSQLVGEGEPTESSLLEERVSFSSDSGASVKLENLESPSDYCKRTDHASSSACSELVPHSTDRQYGSHIVSPIVCAPLGDKAALSERDGRNSPKWYFPGYSKSAVEHAQDRGADICTPRPCEEIVFDTSTDVPAEKMRRTRICMNVERLTRETSAVKKWPDYLCMFGEYQLYLLPAGPLILSRYSLEADGCKVVPADDPLTEAEKKKDKENFYDNEKAVAEMFIDEQLTDFSGYHQGEKAVAALRG
eukprot:g8491.t1